MKTTSIAGGLAVLALTAGLSACGSSSSSKSTSTSTAVAGLSRTELATQANKICATAQSQSSGIKAPADIATNAAAAAAYFDKVFAITDAETKELQALTPTASAATDWQSFVSAQVAADQILQTIKQKADTKDPTGVNTLVAKGKTAGQVVAAAARKIGATTCAGA